MKRLSILALALSTLTPLPALAGAPKQNPDAKLVARGQYLVSICGCNDCHTPLKMGPEGPMPDMDRFLSGHPEGVEMTPPPALDGRHWLAANNGTNTAFAGPWGVSFAANLTPDADTGVLSHWSPDTFIATLRSGRHEGRGRAILPPMPWPVYQNATDADLRAIFAYLQTIPAVKNRVPQPLEPSAAAEPAPAPTATPTTTPTTATQR